MSLYTVLGVWLGVALLLAGIVGIAWRLGRAPSRGDRWLAERMRELPEVTRVRLVPYACKLCPEAVKDGDLVVTVWTPWPVTVHAECMNATLAAVEAGLRKVSG